MKINDTLRRMAKERKFGQTKIADLTVNEFRKLMHGCLDAHNKPKVEKFDPWSFHPHW